MVFSEEMDKWCRDNKISVMDVFLIGRETIKASIMILKETKKQKVYSRSMSNELFGVGLKLIQTGVENQMSQLSTVSFGECVSLSLIEKQHRRARTKLEIQVVTNRMLRLIPGLESKKLRTFDESFCINILDVCFSSSNLQRKKGRAILSGLMTFAVKKGWISCNPVQHVPIPRVVEKSIPILSMAEIQLLLSSAKKECNGACYIPLLLMLYAGVRPSEVTRLSFNDIMMESGYIRVGTNHSKTGGARLVTIEPVLNKLISDWLLEDGCSSVANRKIDSSEKICSRNWARQWALVREKAGWSTKLGKSWIQDILRHTFASHHLLYYKDYNRLQFEMGHRDSSLLRTRYVNWNVISESIFAIKK